MPVFFWPTMSSLKHIHIKPTRKIFYIDLGEYSTRTINLKRLGEYNSGEWTVKGFLVELWSHEQPVLDYIVEYLSRFEGVEYDSNEFLDNGVYTKSTHWWVFENESDMLTAWIALQGVTVE